MSGPARDCCGHRDAWHVDMLDGTEKCAGCDCQTPTGTVVEEEPEHDLTPSEVALSRVLAAWVEWWGAPWTNSDEDGAMWRVGQSLPRFIDQAGRLTPAGTALLDRARKAGVV